MRAQQKKKLIRTLISVDFYFHVFGFYAGARWSVHLTHVSRRNLCTILCVFFSLSLSYNISHSIVIYWKCDKYHVPIKLQNNQKVFRIQTMKFYRSFGVKMYRLYVIFFQTPLQSKLSLNRISYARLWMYHFSNSNATNWMDFSWEKKTREECNSMHLR